MTITETNTSRFDTCDAAPVRSALTPLSGWPLQNGLGELEAALPGFSWQAMSRALDWRQALFLALAQGVHQKPDDFLERLLGQPAPVAWADAVKGLAETLLVARPREVVEAVLGQTCPPGLLGALGKIGTEALPQAEYAKLVGLFSDESAVGRLRRRHLQQVRSIRAGTVAVVETIEPNLLTAAVIERLNPDSATTLMEKVNLVRKFVRDVDDDRLRAAIEDGREWPVKWLLKADRLPPYDLPTDNDPQFERVTPSNAERFGREWGNCLGTSFPRNMLFSGHTALVAWPEGKVLIEMVKMEDGAWIVRDLHRPHNAMARRSDYVAAREKLASLGILVPVFAEPPEDFEAVRKLVGGLRHW